MPCICDLANETLSHVFGYLPPNQRVRIERVCRHWNIVSRELSWRYHKALLLNGQDMVQNCDKALSKYISLIERCGRHLHELNLKGLHSRNAFVGAQLWSSVTNLQHLCLDDTRASSDSVQAIATKLPSLKSVAFSDIDWSCISSLDFLVSNIKLQFLRLPVDKFTETLTFSALPPSLSVLNICARRTGIFTDRKIARIIEILRLAAIHCPKLSVLMLPSEFQATGHVLDELVHFNRLFYLRLCLRVSDASVFDALLERIGLQLKALLLETVDGKILHLIAKHCSSLEHVSFDLYPTANSSRDLFGLRSVLNLPRLRSVSICFTRDIGDRNSLLHIRIMSILRELVSRPILEYLHISRELPLPMAFVSDLFQMSPKIRKLSCRIHKNFEQVELDELNAVLSSLTSSRQRTLALDLIDFCPALNDANNLIIRLVKFREDIDQTLLREFCAQAMDSLPTVWNLDD